MGAPTMKKCQCTECANPWKPLSEFYHNRTKADGHNGICKECQNRISAERTVRKWHEEKAIRDAKHPNKRRNQNFTLGLKARPSIAKSR